MEQFERLTAGGCGGAQPPRSNGTLCFCGAQTALCVSAAVPPLKRHSALQWKYLQRFVRERIVRTADVLLPAPFLLAMWRDGIPVFCNMFKNKVRSPR